MRTPRWFFDTGVAFLAFFLFQFAFADLGSSTPFRDFAGSTVVHTIGGVLAITGVIALGPRLGRTCKRDGGGLSPGHSMTLTALRGVILWFRRRDSPCGCNRSGSPS